MPLDDDALETAATEPAAASGDAGSVTAHPLPDVIKALDRKAGVDALDGAGAGGGPKSGWGALRPARAIPPGSQ